MQAITKQTCKQRNTQLTCNQAAQYEHENNERTYESNAMLTWKHKHKENTKSNNKKKAGQTPKKAHKPTNKLAHT